MAVKSNKKTEKKAEKAAISEIFGSSAPVAAKPAKKKGKSVLR